MTLAELAHPGYPPVPSERTPLVGIVASPLMIAAGAIMGELGWTLPSPEGHRDRKYRRQ